MTGWLSRRESAPILILLILTAAYSIFFSWVTTQRYAAFDSSLDLGSNLVIIEGVIRGWLPAWILITHEGALFSYVFVPILWVSPSADTILIVQTVIIASATIPLYFFARLKLRNEYVALTVALTYLIVPSMQALNWFDIHPEILGMAFIFAFFYYYEIRSYKVATVLCVLALSVSTLVAMGVVAWLFANCLLSLREWRANRPRSSRDQLRHHVDLGLFAGAAIFLAVVEFLMIRLTAGIGVVTGQAGVNLTYPGVGNSAGAVILAPFLQPHAFISNLLFETNLKVLYLVLLFGMFLFLPCFDIRALAGTAPWLYFSFSSTNTPLFTVPYFQYSALLIPFLYFGFVNRLSKKSVPFLEDWGLLWFTLILVVPFAIAPPYYVTALTGFGWLFLVVPIVVVLAIAARARPGPSVTTLIFRRLQSPATQRPGRASWFSSADLRIARVAVRRTASDVLGFTYCLDRSDRRRRVLLVSVFAVVAILLFTLWTPYGSLSSQYVNAYVKPVVTAHDTAFDQFLSLLPINSTIIAQDHLYAHLWQFQFVS
ncbi:MAG: DUF2079 domain-containing protein, partial [Thermoplasmata archaeon]